MAHLNIKKSILYSTLIHFCLMLLFSSLTVLDPSFLKEKVLEKPEDQLVFFDLKEDENQNKIVTSDKGEVTKEVEKNAYLSDKNLKVQKESIKVVEISETAPAKTRAMPAVASEKNQVSEKIKNEFKGSLTNLGVPLFTGNEKKVVKKDQPQWVDQSSPSLKNANGGEYVEGVKEGEVTALNTKEFVFYSYFQRIRKQLDLSWKPILQTTLHKRIRLGRYLAGDMSHKTRTLVILNQEGEIVKVQILEESGVLDLDGAAVEAFNKAGPFPNPPKGLIDDKGEIQVRWDFILRT